FSLLPRRGRGRGGNPFHPSAGHRAISRCQNHRRVSSSLPPSWLRCSSYSQLGKLLAGEIKVNRVAVPLESFSSERARLAHGSVEELSNGACGGGAARTGCNGRVDLGIDFEIPQFGNFVGRIDSSLS
ncbi:unnamed protein product, partial [Urochloa humidicola]